MLRDAWQVNELNWTATPLDMLAAWPAERALMMLHSGRVHARWARWSILAASCVRYQFDGKSRWIGQPPRILRGVSFTNDPLRDLDEITQATRTHGNQRRPFVGGWIGYISYDLGRWIEPRAQSAPGPVDEGRWPVIDLAWCPSALVYDHVTNRWQSIARSAGALAGWDAVHDISPDGQTNANEFHLSEFRPCQPAERFLAGARRAIEYIAAGDVFQANIAQRFSADFAGSPRGLARAAFATAQPWYGAYLELEPERSIVSLSPELFLHVHGATRHIMTRPVKGTRPMRDDPSTLAASRKDAAELHMIIDLMRNDLGRVCEFGSVRVINGREIETHPTVHHGVGEVVGRLRDNVTIGGLLRATFPGGSITGAPKIRAMQIIDELEPARRGPYCGSIGSISDCGRIDLNIAIRTLLVDRHIRGGRSSGAAEYWAGAGIVADSQPQAEYEETLHKAAVLEALTRSVVATTP